MLLNRNRYFMYAAAFGVAMMATACKPPRQIVRGVDVRTYQEGQSSFAEVKTTISVGNISLPAIELPVYDRNSGQDPLGSVGLRPTFNGLTEISLHVNLERVTHADGFDGTLLPNDQPIPVGGLEDVHVVGLQVAKKSRVYVGLSDKVALFGFALSIPEFDNIGRTLRVPVNIFPQFNLDNNVAGVAGIFTGSQSGQNGLAVFVNAQGVIGSGGSAPDQSLVALQQRVSFEMSGGSSEAQPVYFKDAAGTAQQEDQVNSKLYNLHKKRARVKVQ